MNALIFALMTLLFIAVIAWLVMCSKLFRILKEEHPQKHKEMGSPSLFINNNLKSNYKFLKFLFKKEWETLSNEKLSSLGQFMRIFLILFVGIFFIIQGSILVAAT